MDVPAAWYESSPKTLVIFGRASCVACEKAQPFLKGLVTRLNGRAAAVFAHPSGTDADDTAFAKSIGITSDRIMLVGTDLRVRATPTLVLVNQNGTVLAAWEGTGPPERQSDILKAIDVAFIPMNLPYTMTPPEAADAVKAFAPKIVYPYHYRGQDVTVFATALKGTGIDVRQRDWYAK